MKARVPSDALPAVQLRAAPFLSAPRNAIRQVLDKQAANRSPASGRCKFITPKLAFYCARRNVSILRACVARCRANWLRLVCERCVCAPNKQRAAKMEQRRRSNGESEVMLKAQSRLKITSVVGVAGDLLMKTALSRGHFLAPPGRALCVRAGGANLAPHDNDGRSISARPNDGA